MLAAFSESEIGTEDASIDDYWTDSIPELDHEVSWDLIPKPSMPKDDPIISRLREEQGRLGLQGLHEVDIQFNELRHVHAAVVNSRSYGPFQLSPCKSCHPRLRHMLATP